MPSEKQLKYWESLRGRKIPREVVEKIRLKLKGRIFTAEWKKKISVALKGHKPSEESKQKNREWHLGKRSWNKGKHPKYLQECNHPQWKGNGVGYGALHDWVKRHKGITHICEHCGKYVENTKYIHWANTNHKYRRVLEDYIRLCISCHRKYDAKHNDYKGGIYGNQNKQIQRYNYEKTTNRKTAQSKGKVCRTS